MLVVAALFGSSLVNLTLVLSFLLWDRFCIVTRTLAKEQSSRDYVEAARIAGCSPAWLLSREMLPNMVGPLTVVATVEMANAVLLEAALSFLGLGSQPPTPSWGLMLAEAKEDLFFNSWMITLPGLMIFALVLSFNLIGDGLRDYIAIEGRS
jgi:peptide/nickel transport system permease protein